MAGHDDLEPPPGKGHEVADVEREECRALRPPGALGDDGVIGSAAGDAIPWRPAQESPVRSRVERDYLSRAHEVRFQERESIRRGQTVGRGQPGEYRISLDEGGSCHEQRVGVMQTTLDLRSCPLMVLVPRAD